MSLKLGSTDINKGYLGSTTINKAYLGTDIVFSSFVNAFTSTWRTTGASETVQLPISNLYTIDWGDGNITTTATSHEYLVADDYEVKISGVVTDFSINNAGDKAKLINVSKFAGAEVMDSMFYGALNLDITATDNPTYLATSFRMFRNCSSLVYNSSINSHDTSSVVNMSQEFFNATSFNQEVVGRDTAITESMVQRFFGATSFDKDISGSDYSSTTDLTNFMTNKSAANYTATYYDNLLIKWDNAVGGLVFIDMVNVNIGMGTIKYTAAAPAVAARASLISKGFIIADGGLV